MIKSSQNTAIDNKELNADGAVIAPFAFNFAFTRRERFYGF